MKRIFAIILAMIMAVTCFTGCSMSDDSGSDNSGALECGVGQTLSAGDLEFTFVGVEKYVDNSDFTLDKAASGKEFIIFKIKVKNVGDEDGYINMFYEDSYCDDSAIDPVSLLFNYNGDSLWGDVAADRTREGYVAYEAPIGWEKIEFVYEELFGGNKITLVAYAKDVKESNNTVNPGNTGDVNSTIEESKTQETESAEQPSDNECRVGDTVECNGLQFTFVGIEKYVDNSAYPLDKAAEGKEFVILKIKIKNVSDEDDYINMFYEDSYCDDIAVSPVSLLFNYDGDTIWGDVNAGRVREGFVAYELPIGWEKIEFEYEALDWYGSNNKVVLVGYSSDID